jgi:hypothetical protein
MVSVSKQFSAGMPVAVDWEWNRGTGYSAVIDKASADDGRGSKALVFLGRGGGGRVSGYFHLGKDLQPSAVSGLV